MPLMPSIISWGDIPTWISAIGTVAAFSIAFYQIQLERKAREALEKKQYEYEVRKQAEHVSAWVDHEIANGVHTVIAISNRSNEPIYQVIVSIVAFRGAGPTYQGNLTNHFRGFASVAPPGEVFLKVDGGYHGMGFRPSVEIAFADRSNRYWVRKGQGELTSISKDPASYYELTEPLDWQLPQTRRI
jgi:hypothetical protein